MTHYIFDLIDEHRFLDKLLGLDSMSDHRGGNYSTKALRAR